MELACCDPMRVLEGVPEKEFRSSQAIGGIGSGVGSERLRFLVELARCDPT